MAGAGFRGPLLNGKNPILLLLGNHIVVFELIGGLYYYMVHGWGKMQGWIKTNCGVKMWEGYSRVE